MRSTFTLLLFLAFVCSSLHAKISWSKKPYPIAGGAVERADFNNDGYPDLLIYSGTGFLVLLNNGDGTFNTEQIFNGSGLSNVAFLDFNRDGNIDVAGCDGAGNFVILLGHGDGTLTPSQSIDDGCAWVAVSDFNKDGNPDVAVGVPSQADDSTGNQIIVYMGDGKGGFLSEVVNNNVDFVAVDGDPCILNGSGFAADFDGDKVADIAFAASCTQFSFMDSAFIVGKGDGAGHFTFHKDIDYGWTAPTHLRATDFNQDGRPDLYDIVKQTFPHANQGYATAIFTSNGDGTFTVSMPIGTNISDSFGTFITSMSIADVDGDGIKDVIVAFDTISNDSDVDTYSFHVYKGNADGTYTQTGNSPLAQPIGDMVWGDFNKDARPDLAIIRPGSTDVWLNTTATSPSCGTTGLRLLDFCFSPGSPGVFHFISTTLDNRPVNAMQIYVDGVVKFRTPDDLLNINIPIPDGIHRVTVKAWDDNGPFSSTSNVLSCPNTTNRTVRICSPADGATIAASNSSTGTVHIIASAATNLKFNVFQIYVDGQLRIQDSRRVFDLSIAGLSKGTHHITVKGWDSGGAFSSAVEIDVN